MLHKGLIIARYQVDALLGSGGMAEVWGARHTVLGARRALKVLSGHAAPQALLEEGRLQARLDHPNVLPVLDVVLHEDVPVLVMPLVQGPTLRSYLGGGPLPAEQALGLFLGILAGVEAAHAKGVIHRDLKPANVLLQQQGPHLIPRVADFGIAALVGDVDAPRWGTPDYAPPERELGPAGDYWALGIVLHELLLGQRPGGPGQAPEWAAPILAALLEPDPKARLADPEALRALLLATEIPPRPVPARKAQDPQQTPETVPTGPGLDASAPVSAALPQLHDAFVGRETELAGLALLLQTPGLLTLTGPGGVGKTRLSIRVGRQVSGSFPGGVWFVDLSEARSAQQAQATLAAVLSVPLSGKDPGQRLGQALSGRGRALFILDNFEQLVDVASEALDRWVRAAPQASFLVSSRAASRLQGERIMPLDVLSQQDAAALFHARAQQVVPSFQAPEAEVQALVQSLDCLPLAIELAAARSRSMSPAVLQARIADRFRLLVSRAPDRDPRQRTLRATLDWSWELLDPEQQSALAQLSVFEGGFDVDSALAVLELEQAWPEDVLEDLVDRSLVRVKRERGEEPRLGLLVSVQAYAAERLEELGGDQDAAQRHMVHFAQQAPPSAVFASAQAADYLARGRRELQNVRKALDRAIASQRLEAALELATWTCDLIRSKGPFADLLPSFRALRDLDRTKPELSRPLLQILAQPGHESERASLNAELLALAPRGSMLHCRLLRAQGSARWDSADPGQARAPLREALLLARAHQDLLWQGILLQDLALLASTLGDKRVHLKRSRQAIEIFERLGAGNYEAWSWNSLGTASSGEEAVRYYNRALALFEATHHRRGRAYCLQNLALEAFLAGDLELAEQRLARAIRLFRLLGDRKTEGRRGKFLARIHQRRGELDLAQDALRQANAVLAPLGDTIGMTLIKLGQAELSIARGRMDDARAMIDQAENELGAHRAADDEIARIRALLPAG